MNAAARLAHQGTLARHLVLAHLLTRQQMAVLTLLFSVLLSALSIVYVTNVTRALYANYEHNLTEQSHLQVERSQLLLERSTWNMQARIQQIAENKLQMIVPDHKSVVIVQE